MSYERFLTNKIFYLWAILRQGIRMIFKEWMNILNFHESFRKFFVRLKRALEGLLILSVLLSFLRPMKLRISSEGTQSSFTFSKSTLEIPNQCVKYCKVCSELIIKTPYLRQWCRSGMEQYRKHGQIGGFAKQKRNVWKACKSKLGV